MRLGPKRYTNLSLFLLLGLQKPGLTVCTPTLFLYGGYPRLGIRALWWCRHERLLETVPTSYEMETPFKAPRLIHRITS